VFSSLWTAIVMDWLSLYSSGCSETFLCKFLVRRVLPIPALSDRINRTEELEHKEGTMIQLVVKYTQPFVRSKIS